MTCCFPPDLAALASLRDVVLFPQQPQCVRAWGAFASLGLQPCKSVLRNGMWTEGLLREREQSAVPECTRLLIYKSLPRKPGAESRFANQVILFRIYQLDFQMCYRTCKSILGFVNPFKDIEINFWTSKILKTSLATTTINKRETCKSKHAERFGRQAHKLNSGVITSGGYRFIKLICEPSENIRFLFWFEILQGRISRDTLFIN